MELTEKQIKKCFDGKTHQADVLVSLYRIAYPDWDKIRVSKNSQNTQLFLLGIWYSF